MSLSAIVPQQDLAVPSPEDSARYMAEKYGCSFAEVAAECDDWLNDPQVAGRAAEVKQAALRLSLEERRAKSIRFDSHPLVLHSRFARSESRRRKQCKVCARLGRKCGRHARKGGA